MYGLDKAAFGSFLAQLRREKGMTQRELAADLYVSDKAVSKWERGLSVPDISLLVPLAEILNVTVAELMQGRRVEEEQRFTREETEELIRKALTFSAEPPERRQARTQKFLPLYAVYVLLGLVGTAVVCAAGLAGTEGAKALLIMNAIFGVVYGAYTLFWMPEILPRYYDENRICNFAQGGFHIHIPGQPQLAACAQVDAGVVRGVYGPDAALHGCGGAVRACRRLAGVGGGAHRVHSLAVRGHRHPGEKI